MLRGLLAAVVLAALLVGLPWALTHFVGWPLPEHLPSWAEVEGVLLGPMTATFLLDFLVCACWLVWALFTLDVARCAVEVARDARMPELSVAGPVQRVAAVLVGAVLISILGHRVGLAHASPPSSWPGTGSEVVATAPAWNDPSGQGAGNVRIAACTMLRQAAATAVGQPAPAKSVVALAPDPHTGVHDSLWRIAERTLGDGNRWPEIFELNKGKPQPGGGTFIRPSLIFPGEEFALPAGATVSATPDQPPPPPVTPPPTTTTTPPDTPATPVPSTQQAPHTTQAPQSTPAAPSTQQAPPSTDANGEPGFTWGKELFVGLGLASAVGAALVAARRRYRRRYRPGSGDRADLPVAPVVYQLRLAHLRAEQDDEPDEPDERPRRRPVPPLVLGRSGVAVDRDAPVLAVGVRDGREIALDLAAAHGLGMIGAGAAAAVRALLVTALTSTPARRHGGAGVLVPAEDLAALLGRQAAQAPLPAGLRVVSDLVAALDELESETLVRASQDAPVDGSPPVLLVARTPRRQHRRLQAVLDNGSGFGVTGLLLGQWAPGVTAYVRDDGTISTTSPGLGEPLRGTAVFRLGDNHTADLLALLRHADPEDELEPGTIALDERATTPRSRPRVVPAAVEPGYDLGRPAAPTSARPTDTATRTGTAELVGAMPGVATGLELLAAEDTPQADTELEILGPTAASTAAPGLRLRPAHPAPVRGGPVGAASGEPDEQAPEVAVENVTSRTADRADEEPAAVAVPLRISVLGPPQVFWRPQPAAASAEGTEQAVTSAFQPRVRELLVFLALHPDGASREALIAALWASSTPEKTTNVMNTTLSRLRRSVQAATEGALADIVVVGEGRYRLDPELVEVDYHRFAAAVAARRAAVTEQERVNAYRGVVDGYGGPLADGLSTEWIETARESIRRDAIDAVAALARALVEEDPQRTLDLLEVARAFDPHNELIYRDIMRLQERLGQLDAIPRTLALLTTRLAEVADRPTPQAVSLADQLRRRHDTNPDPDPPLGADRGRSRAG